jgi:hypothetical protein
VQLWTGHRDDPLGQPPMHQIRALYREVRRHHRHRCLGPIGTSCLGSGAGRPQCRPRSSGRSFQLLEGAFSNGRPNSQLGLTTAASISIFNQSDRIGTKQEDASRPEGARSSAGTKLEPVGIRGRQRHTTAPWVPRRGEIPVSDLMPSRRHQPRVVTRSHHLQNRRYILEEASELTCSVDF